MTTEQSIYDQDIEKESKKFIRATAKNTGNLIYFKKPPLFLANFPAEVAKSFIEFGIEESYKTHEEILRKGQVGNSLYLIVEGSISVWRQGSKLATLKRAEVFGELILLRGHYRIASIRAEEPTRVLRYTRHMLMDFFSRQNTKIFNLHLINIIEILRHKLISTNEKVVALEQKLLESR